MIDTKQQNLRWCFRVISGLLEDAMVRVPEAAPLLERDVNSLRGRGGSGYKFYLETLPALGKAFDVALVNGRLRGPVPGLGWRNNKPVFLSSLFSRVLDDEGNVVTSPDLDSVRLIRQIAYVFKKVEIQHDQEDETGKIASFLETEEACPSMFDVLRERRNRKILADASALVKTLLRRLTARDIIEGWPRFSGGAVAEGFLPWEKPLLLDWYQVLDLALPLESMLPQLHELKHDEESGMYYEPVFDPSNRPKILERPYSDMAFVPKTYKSPRVIGKEPSAMAFAQQLLKTLMYRHIECHPLTKGHVNFADQEVNRQLALEASRTRQYATLDLKDASNRVWFYLVASLFGGTEIWPYLVATRSVGIDIPREGIHTLKMFSPMGSATTFPVEAIVFWAIAAAAVRSYTGLPIVMAARHVWVYGDDIIIPTNMAQIVMQTFTDVGFALSDTKCCVDGYFRESCGMDAFMGHSVTPVRIPHFPSMREDLPPEPLPSLVDTRNLFYKAGYMSVVALYDEMLEPYIPLVKDDGQELQYLALLADRIHVPKALKRRWTKRYQRSEFRGYASRSKRVKVSPLTFRSTLLNAYLLITGGDPERVKQGWWDLPHATVTQRKWFELPWEIDLPTYVDEFIRRKLSEES